MHKRPPRQVLPLPLTDLASSINVLKHDFDRHKQSPTRFDVYNLTHPPPPTTSTACPHAAALEATSFKHGHLQHLVLPVAPCGPPTRQPNPPQTKGPSVCQALRRRSNFGAGVRRVVHRRCVLGGLAGHDLAGAAAHCRVHLGLAPHREATSGAGLREKKVHQNPSSNTHFQPTTRWDRPGRAE